MHSKSDNIEIMINDKANEVIEELLQSLHDRYQTRLETSIKDSEFVFDCVHLLYYKFHKLNLNRGGSYIDSPHWMRNKIAAINLINKKDNKSFQYAVTIALNHEKIGGHSRGTTNIKPFRANYNWEGINYPSKKDDWEKLEKKN